MESETNSMRVRHLYHIIKYRAFAELRAEASRTYAGYLWWIFQPLLTFGVYYIAFKYVLNHDAHNFAIFLFTGIVIFQWFSSSVMRCSGTLIAARPLMQRVNLHKSVFPLSIILVNTVKFSFSFVILMIVYQLLGIFPGWAWLTLPILLVVELLVITAAGCFSAMISPFVPDFQNILATLILLLFHISGILYDISILPKHLRIALEFNPMTIVVREIRSVLMNNQFPNWEMLMIPVVESSVLLIISMALLHRYDKVYPKMGLG